MIRKSGVENPFCGSTSKTPVVPNIPINISIIPGNNKSNFHYIGLSSKEINVDQLKKIIIKTKPSNLNSLVINKVKNGKLFINLEMYFKENFNMDDFILRGEVKETDIIPYTLPKKNELIKSGLKAYYFAYFDNWDVQRNYEFIKKKITFRTHENNRSPGTFTNYDSLDDYIDSRDQYQFLLQLQPYQLFHHFQASQLRKH